MAQRGSNESLVKHKLQSLNSVLEPRQQRLVLTEQTEEGASLKWQRDLDHYAMEEHVFGGEWFDLFVTLNGIEYGIRMERGR